MKIVRKVRIISKLIKPNFNKNSLKIMFGVSFYSDNFYCFLCFYFAFIIVFCIHGLLHFSFHINFRSFIQFISNYFVFIYFLSIFFCI